MLTFLKFALGGLVLVILVRACNDFIDPSKVGAELNGQWIPFTSFNGSWDQTSSTYNAPNGAARVKWFARNIENRPGTFKMVAKNPTTGKIINDIADVAVAAKGVRHGERSFGKAQEFYLEIFSNVQYEVKVEMME